MVDHITDERIKALERRIAALEIDRAHRVVAARLVTSAGMSAENFSATVSTPPPKPPTGWRSWLKFRFW